MNSFIDPIQLPSWYITTSIPYVNAQPHIGFALEAIQADALARYQRLRGARVRFQSGADENSLKNVQAAEAAGVPTALLVERNARRFQDLLPTLHLCVDDFIRTSAEARHAAGVDKFWRACAARGDIYKRAYQGLYCVGCELFYDEEELANGRCPIHGTTPDDVEEENYFFRLSRYGKALEQLISRDQLRIIPEARKNEVLSFIHRGLRDFSISRSQIRAKGWGLPVPDDPSQVIYVWFDALTNYITALDYAQEGAAYQQFWCNSLQRTHVIGKDIIRFHAIYWPAMLLSAQLPLPTHLFVHGFLTVEGQKISKSLGNAIDPVPLVQEYGVDALRYYLLRKVPATGDSDFSHAEFVRTYNADLADGLGNLVSRVTKMIVQYCDGRIPAPGTLQAEDRTLVELAMEVERQVETELEQFALHKALAAVWSLVGAVNKYVVEVEPWQLARRLRDQGDDPTTRQRLATTLYILAETLRLIACYLHPFLPATADAIARQLRLQSNVHATWRETLVGARVQAAGVLFPKRIC